MQGPAQLLFIFPGLGMGELSIIFLIILLLFGPGKLPSVMRSLGDGVRQFKDATTSKEITSSEENQTK